MAKFFQPDLPDTERLKALKDNADHIEEDAAYERELTQEEVDARQQQFMDNAIKIDGIQSEAKAVAKKFKAQVEAVQNENLQLKTEAKSRKETIKGTLFFMANHVEGMMETYDSSGEMVYSRRLRPDEKQATLFSLSRAAGE